MRSRTASCAVVSTTGRRSAKLRRSPFTAYDRAGNVTLRPLPPRRSQMLKPMSFRPASGDSPPKCSSASASLPAGLPRSFGVILTVMVSELWLVCIVLLLVGNREWFLHVRGGTITASHEKNSGADIARGHGPSTERVQVSWHG